jgi:hypothetical protein
MARKGKCRIAGTAAGTAQNKTTKVRRELPTLDNRADYILFRHIKFTGLRMDIGPDSKA